MQWLCRTHKAKDLYSRSQVIDGGTVRRGQSLDKIAGGDGYQHESQDKFRVKDPGARDVPFPAVDHVVDLQEGERPEEYAGYPYQDRPLKAVRDVGVVRVPRYVDILKRLLYQSNYFYRFISIFKSTLQIYFNHIKNVDADKRLYFYVRL